MLEILTSVIASHPYLCAIGLLTAIWYYMYGNRCNLPGPYGLPFVGYIPFMDRHPCKTFTELGEKYGDVFQVQVGRRTMVVLNSAEAIQDAFGKGTEFTGRPDLLSLKIFAESGETRFAFRHGEQWRFLRRIAAKALGMFASSRNSKLEQVLQDALESLDGLISKEIGKPCQPKSIFLQTISNVIGSVLFGFDFDTKNKSIEQLVDLSERVNSLVTIGGTLDNIPFGQMLMKSKLDEFHHFINIINEITDTEMAKHEYHGDEDHVRDVADALTKVAAEISPEELREHQVDQKKIRFIVQDLFTAGFNTTMETFLWMLNLVADNPSAQAKVQAELDRILEGRKPSLNDKGKLPYLESAITEMLRLTSLVPLGIPHATLQDVTFKGYFIPKGTIVVANYFKLHSDPKLFPNPRKFSPERFINTDGSFNPELAVHVTPFGIGKRRCVGENLARQELFLLMAGILQEYSIRFAPGQSFDPHDALGGFTRIPLTMKLIFEKRLHP